MFLLLFFCFVEPKCTEFWSEKVKDLPHFGANPKPDTYDMQYTRYLAEGRALGQVVVGERDLDTADIGTGEQVMDIESFKIHAGYNDSTLGE